MGVTVIRVPCPSWGSSFTLGFRGACFPFVLPWNVGKLISSALSRKILWPAVSWEGSLHEPRLPRAPFVHLPRSLFHTVSCSFLKRVPVSGGTVLAPVSVCCLILKLKVLTRVAPCCGFIDDWWHTCCPVITCLRRQHTCWLNFVFLCVLPLSAVSVPRVPDLGPPKGIRFSDVTDTSATVHWVIPRARVDSYKVTYVPAHGGKLIELEKRKELKHF